MTKIDTMHIGFCCCYQKGSEPLFFQENFKKNNKSRFLRKISVQIISIENMENNSLILKTTIKQIENSKE